MSPEKPVYGGRALPNGVMMVGPGRMAVAVRQPDGSIRTESAAFDPPFAAWRKTPFIRGLISASGAVMLAFKSTGLQRSMATGPGERAKLMRRTLAPMVGLTLLERVLESGLKKRKGDGKQAGPGTIGVFMPLFAFRLLGLSESGRNLLRYHAAEHMAVNAAEAGDELTAANAGNHSRIHPRCGTSFAVWALLLTRLSRGRTRGAFASLLGAALIVSVSFELLHFGARHRDEAWVKTVFGPTWEAQRLTTMPPEPEHLEVAVEALKAVIAAPPAAADEPVSDIV